MHKLFFLIIALFGICPVLCFSREIVDSLGTHVTIVDSPQRVVTLVPSLGELTADLLGNNLSRLVGVSEYSDYPPALKSKTKLGPYHQLSIEKIVALQPDLVLATADGNKRDQIQHLRELGIKVIVINTETLEAVQSSMRIVALSLGLPEIGNRMAIQFKQGLENLHQRAKSRAPLKVLLQVGDNPLIVAGKSTFLSEGLEIIGAKNVFSEGDKHYPQVSVESVLTKNPDVIVITAFGDDLKAYQQMKLRWNQFSQLKAVKNSNIYILRSDALLRPTMRLLEGLSLLSETIYGKI